MMEPQDSAQSIAHDVENPPQRSNLLLHEPADLAVQRPSIGSGQGSKHDVYETRAVKGLAKQWDEQDRAAKQQARRHTHHAIVPTREAQSDPLPPTEAQQLQQRHRLSLSQEKIRNTFLRTGMKPGAYPGRGSDEEDPDRYVVARQFDSNITDDDDVATSKQEASSGDLEQGEPTLVVNNDEPLVEAFVVTEEEPSVSHIPPPKQDSARPPMVQGDYVDRAKDDDHLRQKTGLYDKPGFFDGLMNRKVFCFVASLICCFLVGAVVVIIVTVTVVGQTSNNSSNAVAPTPPGDSSSAFAPTTLSPSSVNPMLPTPEVDAEETTPAPTSTDTVVTPFPTSKPQEEEEEQDNETEPEETPQPTPRPTTHEPTPETTTAPETPRPTPREPTPEPTLAPAEASTEAPEEDTPDPPATEVPVVVPTPQPTELPTTMAPVPEATSPNTGAPFPPADSDARARIIYDSNYYTTEEINPSEEEQSALDDALLTLFNDLFEAEGIAIRDYTVVSSVQENRSNQWHQTMTVDYYFEGELPALQTILDAFGKTNANAFLRDVIKKSLGPSFEVVNAVDFGFDIPIYG